VLADLKEREPKMKQLAARAAARAASPRVASRAARAGATVGAGSAATAAAPARPAADGADDDLTGYDDTDGPETAGPDNGPGEAESEPTTRTRSAARGADGTRSVSRQQPRRSTAAQRRSAANRKKRR
jgi:hypothetical protein